VFKGNLIVLIDHNSASASEIFSRIIQMEKRGKIIGDTSAGAVMVSRFFPMETGVGNTLYFGASITISDLVMTDGKSLEKTGVIPDEIVLPNGSDIASSKDPVLSYAAKQLGVELTPEKAGTFFPFEWLYK
jgi:carboxyl-terminal processing protease